MKLSILKAANVMASKETTRYYLCGVHLKVIAGQATIEATDGHRLIRFVVQEDMPDCDVIIPSGFIAGIKQNKYQDDIELRVGASAIEAVYLGNTYKAEAIDATYPDTDRLFFTPPTEGGIQEIGFPPEYLGDFAKVNTILGFKKLPIKLVFNDTNSQAVLVKTEHYTGIFMPHRV